MSPPPSFARAWLLLLLLLTSGVGRAAEGSPVDGQIVGVEGERLEVQFNPGLDAQPGTLILIYRRYLRIPNPSTGGELNGETYIGRAVIEEVNGQHGIALIALSEVRTGDLVRLAPERILSTVAADAWVPRGADKQRLKDPFLVPRSLNSRIQLSGEAVRMGKAASDQSPGDYYYGTTLDFTYWPMFQDSLSFAQAMRFGLGLYQGESPELSTDLQEQSLVRFILGFAELDLRLTPYLSFIPQLRLGLNNQGFGAGGGAQLRAGSPQNSHVLVGFEYSQVGGGRTFFEMHHFPQAGLQFWIRAAGENLPAGGDRWGGRIQLGLEKRVSSLVWLSGAVGVGGRRSIEERERGFNAQLGIGFNFDTRRR